MHFKFPLFALFAILASSALAAPSKALPGAITGNIFDAPPPNHNEREELQEAINEVRGILIGHSTKNIADIDNFVQGHPSAEGDLAEVRRMYEVIETEVEISIAELMARLNQPGADMAQIRQSLHENINAFGLRLFQASKALDSMAKASAPPKNQNLPGKI